MNTFIKALETELNNTTTENGAKAYASTLNKCLDLFGQIGACRNNLKEAQRLFAEAYKEDPETATRILFWVRDIRGGQGERSVFRHLFKYLVEQDVELGSKLIPLVSIYGRWDDLLVLENTKVWSNVLELIKYQFNEDLNNLTIKDKPISLLGKWAPSINASSKDSKRLGRTIASYLGLSEKEYRKALTSLRNRIKIVETLMCAKEWSEIDYSKVPSRASFMYRKAFAKQDAVRYSNYLEAVEKGETKINASTLYPYDIVNQYLYKGAKNDKTIDLQWEALPNYMEGNEFNGLVVADVSGSMMGDPMAVSISLAMYIAERNSCPLWKDKFITFSERPTLQTIVGKTIGERIHNLSHAAWGMNTDLLAVFKTILKAAVKNKLNPKDMPEKVIIVSDMQFDQACRSNNRTNLEQVQKIFDKAGYKVPQLIFWNVRASNNVPITYEDNGTCLVSGCSPSTLKTLLSGAIVTPLDTMKEVLYNERYELVGQAFV